MAEALGTAVAVEIAVAQGTPVATGHLGSRQRTRARSAVRSVDARPETVLLGVRELGARDRHVDRDVGRAAVHVRDRKSVV